MQFDKVVICPYMILCRQAKGLVTKSVKFIEQQYVQYKTTYTVAINLLRINLLLIHSHVLVKALPPFCMKYTAQGES